MIREARTRARLTQNQLAVQANVTQSVVSAYESSKREPSFGTLKRLVSAAGFDLEVMLNPSTSRSAQRTSLDRNRAPLMRALEKLGASNIRLFGSLARGDERAESDIDVLVDVGPEVGLFALGQMRSEAERILGANVDIVPANSLKPDVLDRVLAEAVPL